MRSTDTEWEIARIFQYIIQIFIVVGILGLIVNRRKTKFHPEYAVLSLVSMVIIAISISLPYFAGFLNMSRIYHITLFFLAPFCILGGIATFRWLFRIFRLHWIHGDHAYLKLIVISVVVPYFLFTTGVIFQLTGATPGSMALALYRADWLISTDAEAQASQWVGNNIEDNVKTYADRYAVFMLSFGGMRGKREPVSLSLSDFPDEPDQINPEAYIFLRRWNIVHGEILSYKMIEGQSVLVRTDLKSEPDLTNALREKSKIYDNHWAQVFGAR